MKESTFKTAALLVVVVACLWGGFELGELSHASDSFHNCIWREIKEKHSEQIVRMEQEHKADCAQHTESHNRLMAASQNDCSNALALAVASMKSQQGLAAQSAYEFAIIGVELGWWHAMKGNPLQTATNGIFTRGFTNLFLGGFTNR
jgi:hypothetical protein